MKRIRVWGIAGAWLALALMFPRGSWGGPLPPAAPLPPAGPLPQAAPPAVELAATPAVDLPATPATWVSARMLTGLGEEGNRQPAPAPRAQPRLRRQRPNTISLGLQGQVGAVRGNSRIADGFDQGIGYAFRFRYMLSPSSALGFSFEHQRYGAIQAPNNSGVFADSHVVITTVSVEGIFYVHREREFNPYFLGGVGLATPDIVFTDLQTSRVNEGLFALGGLGFERFIRPRFSLDFSVRGYALVSNSEFTSMGQVSLGIHGYPGD